MPITSEKRLRKSPSVQKEITLDQTNKIEAAEKDFDKITKQVLPNQKKSKIEYNEKSNNYNLAGPWIQMKTIKKYNIYFHHFKGILKMFLIPHINCKLLIKKAKTACFL